MGALSIHTTVRWASISLGMAPSSSGAVGFMAKAARIKVAGAPHPPPLLSRTIAMRDLLIGCRAGLLPKRHGAVRTRGRAALQRLEDVPDCAFDGRRDHGAGPGAIFRCHEDV